MMRSASGGFVAAVMFAFGLMVLVGGARDSALAADPSLPAAAARPTPAISGDPAAPGFVGKSLSSGGQLQLGRRRIGQIFSASQASPAPAADAPPAPIDRDEPVTDAPADSTRSNSETVAPPVVGLPPIPFVGRSGASAFHERLRAKRLGRVQQMRQSAEQTGDTQGVERAQYLEGMVNELHNQGLFNFAQKVMGAIQEGKLNGAGAGAAASSGSVELPEADLGEAAPLPETDLGQPAPLPTDDAAPHPEVQTKPQAGPQLPPADGGDAPPANH